MSALPSRFVADQFLPSPSSFYPDWGFGSAGGGRSASGDGGNMLPSPLNWQTPVGGNAPGFGEKSGEGDSGVKRERDREGGDEGESKRIKA
jgi:transcription factor RLM1